MQTSASSRVQTIAKTVAILAVCSAFVGFAIACSRGFVNVRDLMVTPELTWIAGLLPSITPEKLAGETYVFLSGFFSLAFVLSVMVPNVWRRMSGSTSRMGRPYVIIAVVLLGLACLLMLLHVSPIYSAAYRLLTQLFRLRIRYGQATKSNLR